MEEIKDVKIEVADPAVEVKSEFPEGSSLARLVKPHTKKSREVTDADLKRVAEDAVVLRDICYEQYGIYKGAYAMHHSQIDDKDPLNFFVTSANRIIINPKIVQHSNYTTDSKEGCVTYPQEKQTVVQRWQKIETEYVTIMVDPNDKDKFVLSSPIQEHFSGLEAKIFQHESDHGNAKYIHNLPIE